MKRIVPLLIGFLVVGAFVWTLVFLYKKSQEKPVVFETGEAVTADIVKKTVATGAIVPRREIEIKPRVSGVLEELYVEAGKPVVKGQKIAKIKIVPNMVNLSSAEAAVKQARITFTNAASELARNEDLFRQNLISEAERSRARLEHELRSQELAAATDNLQLIKSGASKSSGKVSNVVSSTVEGMVIDVPVKLGASVTETNTFNEGTTIASVADMNDMIFEGNVDESEVGKIKEGMELSIQVGALESERFQGVLEYIAPKGVLVDGAIQFQIRAAIKQKEDVFIRAGYSANADIVLERRDGVLAVDEALLQFSDDKTPFVEVLVGPQQFERRDLEVGLSDGVRIQILSGVGKDDKIKKPLGAGPSPGRQGA